jgi:hypothetical protein
MTEPTDLAEQLRFLHDNTLPELRRSIEHDQASKARWRARAEKAEAALAALHEGEEPHLDERTVPTPGQWIWQWNQATTEERLDVVGKILNDADHHYGCFMNNWPDRARDAEARIAVVRALHHDDSGLCAACTSSHGVPWPCPTVAALDGPADTPAATPVGYCRTCEGQPRATS